MRDVKSTEGSWSWIKRYNPPVCGNDIVSETSGSQVRSESARASISQGNHIDPTSYSAYRRRLNPLEFAFQDNVESRRWCDDVWKYYHLRTEGTRSSQVEWINLIPSGSVHLPSIQLGLMGRARNSCLSNIRNQDVDLGQTLGEAYAELGQLSSLAVKLGGILVALKRGHVKVALKRAGLKMGNFDSAASEGFLAMKFGVMPIIQDMLNLDEAIHKALNQPSAVVSAVGTAVDYGDRRIIGGYEVDGEMLTGAQVGVLYKIDSPTLAGLNGLGLVNPFSLGWELLPLSFVIDWFLSIGDFLAGMSTPLGLSFRSGYETEFVKTDVTMVDTYYRDYQNGTRYSGTWPSWKLNEFGMSRTIIYEFPRPSVVLNTGGFSVSQTFTLGAIAAQLRKH